MKFYNWTYKVYSKSIKTESEFTKLERNNAWNINFVQNSPFSIQNTYSIKFSIGQSTFEIPLLIQSQTEPSYFCSPYPEIFEMNFQSRKQENIAQSWRSGEYRGYCICIILFWCKKHFV